MGNGSVEVPIPERRSHGGCADLLVQARKTGRKRASSSAWGFAMRDSDASGRAPVAATSEPWCDTARECAPQGLTNRRQCSSTSTMLNVSSAQYCLSSAPHCSFASGSRLPNPYIIS